MDEPSKWKSLDDDGEGFCTLYYRQCGACHSLIQTIAASFPPDVPHAEQERIVQGMAAAWSQALAEAQARR